MAYQIQSPPDVPSLVRASPQSYPNPIPIQISLDTVADIQRHFNTIDKRIVFISFASSGLRKAISAKAESHDPMRHSVCCSKGFGILRLNRS
ncbi:hypothetical protein [Leptospira santarosai]|uniref:hypothetical protein n=1 Tax=Leptospira santarosai TaxID=28183 RepID=UPI0014797D30|nr:hypothetical protein [Leptospira santarosai]